MLSRVADSIFWINRYLERADNVARFIIVNKYLLMDLGIDSNDKRWQSIISTTGDDKLFTKKHKTLNEEKAIKFLTFDDTNPNSIISCISYARENARTIREVISSEIWNHINELYHFINKHKRKRSLEALDIIYKSLINFGYMYTGLYNNTMTRDECWHFGNIGRMLERSDKTSRIIDVKHFLLQANTSKNNPYDSIEWGALLKSASAYEAYFKTHHYIDYRHATDFLIFNDQFPRSIDYSLTASIKSLLEILKFHNIKNHSVLSLYLNLKKLLENSTIDEILNSGVHQFIDSIQTQLNNIGMEIQDSFFQGKVHNEDNLGMLHSSAS